MKQRDRVIRHLMDWGSLTALEALREYGIMHLASRIDELRKDGWPIQTVPMTDKNRYGEKVTYAKYVLIRALCKPAQDAEGRARRQKR